MARSTGLGVLIAPLIAICSSGDEVFCESLAEVFALEPLPFTLVEVATSDRPLLACVGPKKGLLVLLLFPVALLMLELRRSFPVAFLRLSCPSGVGLSNGLGRVFLLLPAPRRPLPVAVPCPASAPLVVGPRRGETPVCGAMTGDP